MEIIDVGTQIVGSIKSFGPDRDRPGKTIDFGSRVKKGDVLARLDDMPHKAALDNARATLKMQEAELKHSLTAEKQAERDFLRPKSCAIRIPWRITRICWLIMKWPSPSGL